MDTSHRYAHAKSLTSLHHHNHTTRHTYTPHHILPHHATRVLTVRMVKVRDALLQYTRYRVLIVVILNVLEGDATKLLLARPLLNANTDTCLQGRS